jgi:hypothetical protein
MATTPDLDPVSIAAAIAGSLLGPQLAPYIGAYFVVLLAWVGGVIVGSYRRDPRSRMGLAAFVAVTFVMALGLTASIASLLASKMGVGSTVPLFLVAFAIPAVGDSWIDIAKWAAGRLRSKWEKE